MRGKWSLESSGEQDLRKIGQSSMHWRPVAQRQRRQSRGRPFNCSLDQTAKRSKALISEARDEGYPAGISDTQRHDHFDVAARLQMDLRLEKHLHQQVQGCHAKEAWKAKQRRCGWIPTCRGDPPPKHLWERPPTFSARPPSGWGQRGRAGLLPTDLCKARA